MEFQVTLSRYNGPYTKLLELIEQKKLSITEIDLVSVADEYIAYIQTLGKDDIIDISQFIVVASTLMLMKAKSLLPGVVYTEDEEKQVHELESKLALYSVLVEASAHIRDVFKKAPLYKKERTRFSAVSVFVPDTRVDIAMIESIARLTIASFVVPAQLVKVRVEQALRIENVIEALLTRVQNMQSVSLQSLANGAKTIEEKKKLLIVNFLALLELLRNGTVYATQPDNGGDVVVSSV